MSSQSDNLYLKLDRSSIKSESNSGTNLFEKYNLVNELAKAKTKVFYKYVYRKLESIIRLFIGVKTICICK